MATIYGLFILAGHPCVRQSLQYQVFIPPPLRMIVAEPAAVDLLGSYELPDNRTVIQAVVSEIIVVASRAVHHFYPPLLRNVYI